jgi:hypothetical protein
LINLDPGVALAEVLRSRETMPSSIVASICSVDAAVVLYNVVLEVLPELLHLAVGDVVVNR